MNVFDLSARITMDINGYLKGMDTAKATALSTMSIVGGAVSDFVSDSINVGKSFDSSISQVAATMGGTMQDLQNEVGTVDTAFGTFSGNLRDYAQYMGTNTVFSATQAADALNYMALAGYKTQQSMEMLPNVLNLAAAGNFDLARASDMVTDTQTAFGISTSRTNQLVDEMAKAASTGNTSVEQLGDAFLVVGGLAQELNGGMVTLADGTQAETDGVQELEIALTAMANAGIKGSEAGTHMRNMLLKLSSPTDEGAEQMKALGVSIFDTEGNMRSLQDIMGDLNRSLSRLTQEEKIKAISELFNTRDLASAEALLNAVGEDWNKIGEEILNAKGSAQKMADTQLDNLAGDTTLFESAMEGLQIAISDGATPALRFFTQSGTALIQEMTDVIKGMPEPLRTVISMLGLVGGAALEAAPGFVSMAANMSILAKNVPAVGKAFSGLKTLFANPIFLGVAASIGVAVAAFIQVKRNIEENTEAIRNLRDEAATLKESVGEASGSITEMATTGLSASDAADQLAKAQENLATAQDASKRASEGTKEAVSAYAEALRNAADTPMISGGLLTDMIGVQTALGTVKEAQESYTQAVRDYSEAQAQADSDLQAAQNAVSGLTFLTQEMTDSQRLAAEETLNMLPLRTTEEEAYNNVINAIDTLNQAHDEEVATLQEKAASISEAIDALNEEYMAAYEEASKSLEGQFGLFQQMPEIVSQATYDTIEAMNASSEAFDESAYQVGMSVTDMISALDSQIAYMDQYAANIEEAARLGIDEGLLEKLSDGSKESAAILQSIVDDGGAHMDELVEKFNKVEEGKDSFSHTVAEMRTDFQARMYELVTDFQGTVSQLNMAGQAYDAGIQTIQGVINGSNAMSPYLQSTYANLAIQSLNAYKSALMMHSPSRLFEESGENTMLGVIVGAEGQRDNLRRTYRNLAGITVDAYDAEVEGISVPSANPAVIASRIPRSETRERPQTVNLVLNEQVIGRVLLPLIQGESERIGLQIGGAG